MATEVLSPGDVHESERPRRQNWPYDTRGTSRPLTPTPRHRLGVLVVDVTLTPSCNTTRSQRHRATVEEGAPSKRCMSIRLEELRRMQWTPAHFLQRDAWRHQLLAEHALRADVKRVRAERANSGGRPGSR